jgi:5-formyltetrahydrofolate cyclo-ligase
MSDPLAMKILAKLLQAQKEQTVASVLEVHSEAITKQCLRNLLTMLPQGNPQVASEVCHLNNR